MYELLQFTLSHWRLEKGFCAVTQRHCMSGSGLYEESNCLRNVENHSCTDTVSHPRRLILILRVFEIKLFQGFKLFLSERRRISDVKKKKCKAVPVPLQAWGGPEGSRKLRFPDYMTTARDGGKVVSLTHRPPLPPGNAPGTHFC